MTINEIPCLFSFLCSCVFFYVAFGNPAVPSHAADIQICWAVLSWCGSRSYSALALQQLPHSRPGAKSWPTWRCSAIFLIGNSLFGPRDVLLRKNSCSFRHCPNYLPHPPIRSTCTTFFLTKKFRIWKSLRIKSTIYTIYIQPKTVKSSNSWHFVRNRLLL